MKKLFIQYDSLKTLMYPRTKSVFLRCNPSMIIVSSANHVFEKLYSVYSKSPVDKWKEMTVKRCYRKQGDGVHFLDVWSMDNYLVKADVGLKILDISHLDYPWMTFKTKFGPEEELEQIHDELQSVAQSFEFYGKLDGYLIENNQFLFFKKRIE